MSKETLQAKRQKLADELAKLDREIDALEALSEVEQLADSLHGEFCRLAHEDQCSWHYETWENYQQNKYSPKRDWVKRAHKLMKALPAMDNDQIVQVGRLFKGM